jgi:flagellar basal body-associated protein FliL
MSDEGHESGKGGKSKLIIIAVAVLVLLGGGGFGAKLWLDKRKVAAEAAAKKAEEDKKKAAGEVGEAADPKASEEAKKAEEDEEDEHAAKSGGGHGAPEAAPVMVLQKIVNLQGPRKNAFLRVEFNILFRDAELGKLAAGEKVTPEQSLIKATILKMVSGKTVEEAADSEAQESLRLEIKDKLNDMFKPKPPKPGEKEDKEHKKPKHPIKDVLIVDWAIQQ